MEHWSLQGIGTHWGELIRVNTCCFLMKTCLKADAGPEEWHHVCRTVRTTVRWPSLCCHGNDNQQLSSCPAHLHVTQNKEQGLTNCTNTDQVHGCRVISEERKSPVTSVTITATVTPLSLSLEERDVDFPEDWGHSIFNGRVLYAIDIWVLLREIEQDKIISRKSCCLEP